MRNGAVIWLTGLPSSGKTTIAKGLMENLRRKGYAVELLDGDWVRQTINPDAGFTREQRSMHLIRVAWIARLLARNNIITICSFVSPYRDVRAEIRKIIEEEAFFMEAYVKCSLEECMKRDSKGLYKKALAGEIKNFTGIDDPYEEPENPEIILDTEHYTIEENVNGLINKLKEYKLIEDGDIRGHGDKVIVKISKDIYEKAEELIKESGSFQSVEELIEFLLNEVLSGEQENHKMTKEEEEEVKKRLRSLGYI
jgi:adenylylsulfate kinase